MSAGNIFWRTWLVCGLQSVSRSPGWPWHDMNMLTRRILTRRDTEIIDKIDIETPDTQHLEHDTPKITWLAKNNMARQNYGTKLLKMFFSHVPTSWGHVKKSGTKFLKIFFTHVPTRWRQVKNICPSSAKRICYFSVCHRVFSQGSTHNNRGARVGGGGRYTGPMLLCVEPWLNTQWQTEK